MFIFVGEKNASMKNLSLLLMSLLLIGCFRDKKNIATTNCQNTIIPANGEAPKQLSAYGFFKDELKKLIPNDGVYPYDLNSALFTDYAFKARFFFIPKDSIVPYETTQALDLPIGSYYIKNFYYPADFNKPEAERRIIETRILRHLKSGWEALPYIWNDAQTDAELSVAGGTLDVSWTHYDGSRKNITYLVPNKNQCKSCHWNNETIKPIGPTVKNLNRNIQYADGTFNQLEKWVSLGYLKGLPDMQQVPKMVAYNDTSASINDRARAYLDINCAHCHRMNGPAYTSGLHLNYENNDNEHLGICKSPVAAGKGTGGLMMDIVPGKPDESILLYRMASTDAGIKMPELGRVLAHDEGVKLIAEWIKNMQGSCK